MSEIITDVLQDRDWKRKGERFLSEIGVASWAHCEIRSKYQCLQTMVISTDEVSHFPLHSFDNLQAKCRVRLRCNAEEH
jgi:hypothetical protein